MATKTPPVVDDAKASGSPREQYARMAASWWMAAVVLLILPVNLVFRAFTAEPPPAGPFQTSLMTAQLVTAVFFIGTFGLYWSWRNRLPAVMQARWYGPAEDGARRRGFWLLWTFCALWAFFFQFLLGQRGLEELLINGPAAYLRPEAGAFYIEQRSSGAGEGLVHLPLRNSGNYEIPLTEGQPLGELLIESPSGPYLFGGAQLSLPVDYTKAQVALQPLPTGISPRTTLEFLVPFERWGQVVANAPPMLRLTVRYYPTSSAMGPRYQPMDLYDGPLHALATPE